MVFFRQLKSVLWKNFIIKLRHPVGLFLEFAFPLLVIIGLWGIRLSLNSRITEQYIPKNSAYAPSIDDFYNQPWCGSEQLVWLCAASAPDCGDAFSDDANSFPGCKLRRIAVAPHDSSDDSSVSATHKFVAWANQTIPATSQNTLFVIFDSEKEFLRTIDKSSYSRIADDYIYSSLIVFESGYPQWDYTVRMNRSRAVGIDDFESTPQTRIDPVFNGVDTARAYPDDGSTWYTQPYLNGYRDMGMFAVLETVNSFIATETCRATSQCTDAENVKLRVEGTADFPNVLIKEDIFWQALGSSFAILMVLSVLYPVSNVIKTLVAEKESKMREGMMMMSLRLDVIWTGWIIMFLCVFVPLSVFLMLVGQFIFVFSDLDLIFLYFISFFLAALAFCVLISIVFSKAKTASIFGSFIFFAGYIIYQSLVDTGMSRSQLTLACLHPSTAFCFGTLAFAEYEDSKIGVTSNTWDVSQQSPITFQDCIVMQFVNIAWMLALAWYLSQTWPSEYGLHKPWYFLLLPSYWSKTVTECCGTNQQQVMVSRESSGEGVEMSHRGAGDDEPAAVPIEDVPAHLKAQVGEKKCVHINNLRKSFNTATGQKVAVDGLNMTFYSGQITALLGHNGAGKSTAISMLTGLYPPDTGSATVQGFDIGTDMLEARKVMGVCPQHDVLEPFMTVEEHLQFFASVKGCPPEEIEQEVTSIIESVGLKEKRKEFSKNLSGGQKRKLSVVRQYSSSKDM
jgi:ATP-binding cassette, subfamily A (ABC1), member 3